MDSCRVPLSTDSSPQTSLGDRLENFKARRNNHMALDGGAKGNEAASKSMLKIACADGVSLASCLPRLINATSVGHPHEKRASAAREPRANLFHYSD